MSFNIKWVWRSREPAKCWPDKRFPNGVELDISKGRTPTCVAKLPYPAKGLGVWHVICNQCGYSVAITAAGRPDDPTQVTIPCKRVAHG